MALNDERTVFGNGGSTACWSSRQLAGLPVPFPTDSGWLGIIYSVVLE